LQRPDGDARASTTTWTDFVLYVSSSNSPCVESEEYYECLLSLLDAALLSHFSQAFSICTFVVQLSPELWFQVQRPWMPWIMLGGLDPFTFLFEQ
jgi:hypothetical protein